MHLAARSGCPPPNSLRVHVHRLQQISILHYFASSKSFFRFLCRSVTEFFPLGGPRMDRLCLKTSMGLSGWNQQKIWCYFFFQSHCWGSRESGVTLLRMASTELGAVYHKHHVLKCLEPIFLLLGVCCFPVKPGQQHRHKRSQVCAGGREGSEPHHVPPLSHSLAVGALSTSQTPKGLQALRELLKTRAKIHSTCGPPQPRAHSRYFKKVQ